MPLSPFDSTNYWTMFSMACHHVPWTEHKSDDVMLGMHALPLGSSYGRRKSVWHVIIALGQNIQVLTTSSVTCYHRPCATHPVRRRRMLHACMDLGQHILSGLHTIIALGQHTRSDKVGHGVPSRSLTTYMVGLLGA